MRDPRLLLVVAGLVVAGCSGHANPDATAAYADRRTAELRAAVGRRASVVRLSDEGHPLVVYDVHDLICPLIDFPAPELSLRSTATPTGGGSDGVLTFEDEAEDEDHPGTCVDPDELVELVSGKLGLEGEESGCSVDYAGGLLVVRGPWWSHEKVVALVLALAAAPRHGLRGGSKPPGR